MHNQAFYSLSLPLIAALFVGSISDSNWSYSWRIVHHSSSPGLGVTLESHFYLAHMKSIPCVASTLIWQAVLNWSRERNVNRLPSAKNEMFAYLSRIKLLWNGIARMEDYSNEQSAKYVNETPLKPPFPKGVTIWIWRFGSKRGFANSAKCTYRCFLIIKYPRILIHVKL